MTGAQHMSIDVDAASRRRWDAVVVGAGPAGALTAYLMARRGASVLLIDRAAFPRDKVCGCCVSGAAWRTIEEVGLAGARRRCAEAPIGALRLMARSASATLTLGGGSAVARGELDAALVEAAVSQGVCFLPRSGASASAVAHDARELSVRTDGLERRFASRVVIDACGLGGLASRESDCRDRVAKRSYMGLSALFEPRMAPREYASGTVHMACGRGGYVGLVRLADGRLNVAAAVDPARLRRAGGPAAVVRAILDDAGTPRLPDGPRLTGTKPLTRRVRQPGRTRLFAVGDAAGYVEPFTGEGIAWALESARRVTPMALEAVRDWSDLFIHRWACAHRAAMRLRHARCRAISAALRCPQLVRACLPLINLMPRLFARTAQAIHGDGGASGLLSIDDANWR